MYNSNVLFLTLLFNLESKQISIIHKLNNIANIPELHTNSLESCEFLPDIFPLSKQCVNICFSELILFLSLIFVGHITGDTVEFDAAALAISFINVTATSVCHGLSTAAETLCSQVWYASYLLSFPFTPPNRPMVTKTTGKLALYYREEF